MRKPLADPYGTHALERLERRFLKIHARRAGLGCHSVCDDPRARYFSDQCASGDITCRRCLYLMGLYMPLDRLYEHQTYNRTRHSHQIEFFYRTSNTRRAWPVGIVGTAPPAWHAYGPIGSDDLV